MPRPAPRRSRNRRQGDPEDERRTYTPVRRGPNPAIWIFAITGLLIIGVAAFFFLSESHYQPRDDTPTGINRQGEATTCPNCRGTGRFDCPGCEAPGTTCSDCNGYGYLECVSCAGTGK